MIVPMFREKIEEKNENVVKMNRSSVCVLRDFSLEIKPIKRITCVRCTIALHIYTRCFTCRLSAIKLCKRFSSAANKDDTLC